MRPFYPTPLAKVPGIPAELVGPLAAHGIKTVGDLVARVQQANPGLLPPAFALGLNVWQLAWPITDREPAREAGRVLAEHLGLGEHQRPADWTDLPPEIPMPATKPRTLPTAALSLHPQAGLVPEMPPDQYALFLADVKARGVLDPIELIPGTRTVIEGRTRLRAATDAGLVEVPVMDAPLGDDPPVLYMLRSALLRRHLTKGQAATLAVEIEAELAKAAKERKVEGASKGGFAAGESRRGERRSQDPERIPEGTKDRSGEAREQAAAAAGVNPRYVTDAKLVKAKAPELYEKVKAGTVTLPEATRAVKGASPPPPPPPPEPPPVVASVRGGPEKLEPCPFCGSADVYMVFVTTYYRGKSRPMAQNVQCRGCRTCGPTVSDPTPPKVRAAWNRRAK